MRYYTKPIGRLLLATAVVTGAVLPVSSTWASSTVEEAQNQQVKLFWGGQELKDKGLLIQGKTMIPVSALRDDLKLGVSYDAESLTYTINGGQNKVRIYDGSDEELFLNVNQVYMKGMEGTKKNGKLYIPIGVVKNYLGIQAAWDGVSKQVRMSAGQNEPLKWSTEPVLQKEESTVEYDIHTLKLEGDYPGIAKINEILKKRAEELAAASKESVKTGGPTADHPFQFENNYLVTDLQADVVSLVVDEYGYLGGAHGMTVRKGYTFSLKDGQLLKLEDVLGANPNYLKALNDKLTPQVTNHGGYLGDFKGIGKDQDFYLSPAGVVIFFQQYEYTAYAAGIPEFVFPYSSLLPQGKAPFSR